MQRDEQLRVIDALMKHLDEGTNVDAGCQVRNASSSYTCPDIAKSEWQRFFQDYPQVVGLSADLPNPRSFFTSSDLGKPVLCTRDDDGQFHAFLNVCRHRGTIVESEARGEKRHDPRKQKGEGGMSTEQGGAPQGGEGGLNSCGPKPRNRGAAAGTERRTRLKHENHGHE